MSNEHEPIRLPSWRTSLRTFEAARDTYVADRTPHNLRLAQTLGELLTVELMRPGRFALGQIVETIGAHNTLAGASHLPAEFLLRHKHGDWGELPAEDIRENEWSLENGARLFSAYRTRTEEKLWVITEWDRSVTTLLLPEEY
jgi:hypothetical protein